MFAWDLESYRVIMQIYTAYDLWASTYVNDKYDELHYELRISNCFQRLDIVKEALEETTKDREFAYNEFYEARADLAKQEFRSKIKNILFGIGGGVLGIAAGIVIGSVATK